MSSLRRQPSRSRGRQRVALCLSLLASYAFAFQSTSRLQYSQTTPGRTVRSMAAIDPTDLAHTISSVHHHATSSWDAILSTLYTTTNLSPAHGHSNPLFGPPDPYLEAGSSIAPNLKGFMTDGATQAATTQPELPEVAKAAAEKGSKILDPMRFESGGGEVLPGFKATNGIFPRHISPRPGATATTTVPDFERQVENTKRLLTLVKNMLFPAFLYVFVDVAFLQQGQYTYKEDIEEEPVDAIVDAVQATGVRLGVFGAIVLVTAIFFSG